MTKYLIKRILHGLVSVVIVVGIVMLLIYSALDRQLIFAMDPTYKQLGNNQKEAYMYRKWEEYGYIDYVPYTEYLLDLTKKGEITEEERTAVASIGKKAENDSEQVAAYVQKFTDYYKSKGYEIIRRDAKMQSPKKYVSGGQQQLFAYKDKPLLSRLLTYFTGIVSVDNIHYVQEEIEDRGLTFTLHDPLYGGEKFSPAIIGNGTRHKYLVYFDDKFPFIHQNLVQINLGKSYSVNLGVDVFETMMTPQGSYVLSNITYPTGLVEDSADDLHSAVYIAGSREANLVNADRFTDDYTSVQTVKNAKSKVGFSFVIGIISSMMAYALGVPLGIMMARKKDKFLDKLGTAYIMFITAVPSLAYIFLFRAIGSSLFNLPTTFDMENPTRLMYVLPVISLALPSLAYIFLFKAIGGAIGLPTTFDIDKSSWMMYVLPIVSLALPSIANLMKWLRRYMIDQMNSDYVKFARSGGLSENEIFTKHILKNAIIPLVHGIPGTILFSITGAIITERVYVVPGAGNLLTKAINMYDNSVIVGVTLFYALLSIISLILGDILMSLVDPRISFTSKAR